MHDINKAECPGFKRGDNIEAILEWAQASVEWSDTTVNGKGECRHRPELAHWSLVWKPGFIGFCSIREDTPEDMRRAKFASALFIYLWCQDVDAAVAAHCAEAYINYYKVEEEEDEGLDPQAE